MSESMLANGREAAGWPPESPEAGFDVKVVEAGRTLLAQVEGPLDVEFTPRFLNRVQPLCGSGKRLVVDLRQAQYLDSAGVRALLFLRGELERQQGEIRLVIEPRSRVERTLSLLQLLETFQTYDSASDTWAQCRAA